MGLYSKSDLYMILFHSGLCLDCISLTITRIKTTFFVHFSFRRICFIKRNTMKPVTVSKPNLLCLEFTDVLFIQGKLTKIAYIGTYFKVQFKQDSILLRVRFRQVSLYIVILSIVFVLSVLLRFTNYEYPFGIFKLFHLYVIKKIMLVLSHTSPC